MWKTIDKNGDGQVDKMELAEIMASLGETLTGDELDKVFARLDRDDDGSISFAEFVSMMKETQSGRVRSRASTVVSVILSLTKLTVSFWSACGAHSSGNTRAPVY